MLGTRKTTQGNRNIWFPKITQETSSSPSIILRELSILGRSGWPYQAKCILPLSDPIGLFKLIVSFLSIWSRTFWEFPLPLSNPMGFFESIVKFSSISRRSAFPVERFHWLIWADSLIFSNQVNNFSTFEWFGWTVQSWLPYTYGKIMAPSATAINNHSDRPRHARSLQPSSSPSLE